MPATRDQQLHAAGPLRFAGGAEDEVVVELSAEAPFFTAALALDGTATELVCWDRIAIFGSPWSTQPVALPHFDSAQGVCVNADGSPASPSVLPLEFVLDTYHGDCADLRGAQLNAGDYANPDIFVSLRGADLTGASLQFAQLSGSLEGARLGALDYGYASVSGSIDEATVLPALGECVVTESEWGADSVTCQR